SAPRSVRPRPALPRWRGPLAGARSYKIGAQVEPYQHPLGVREIADDLLDRLGKVTHERGYCQNLIAAGELRVLQQIDDLDPVPVGQMLLADALEVGERAHAFWSLTGNVEAQNEAVCLRGGPFFQRLSHGLNSQPAREQRHRKRAPGSPSQSS